MKGSGNSMKPVTLALCVCALSLAAVWLGCAPKPSVRGTGVGADTTRYDFEEEGSIPPLRAEDIRPVPDAEELPIEERGVDVEEIPVENVSEPPDSAQPGEVSGEESSTEGFRIQLFALQDGDRAQALAGEVGKKTGLPVYVSFEGGYYKVRVGDFTERTEAEAQLDRLREAGFVDAWVVKCRVFKRRAR